MTRFGPVDFERSRYRPSGTGPSIIAAANLLGLTTGGMTPVTASLARDLMSGRTARERAEAWRQFCGKEPAIDALRRRYWSHATA